MLTNTPNYLKIIVSAGYCQRLFMNCSNVAHMIIIGAQSSCMILAFDLTGILSTTTNVIIVPLYHIPCWNPTLD